MAENKNDRVEVMIPRPTGKEDPNYFVSVNGHNFLLPRGKKSLVPKAVALEIQRSARAQDMQDNHMDELLSRAAK